ncbi:MAG: Ppx/GppA family phosphatase, partial [Alphaproteobacteria bacterium]|nr:Ppx/GppA family phosphatase [Alphaproteobacteria bacterium]
MTTATLLPARTGKLPGKAAGQPVAVLDIGSNSVRMVIYERATRALTPMYNEKVACALGRGVGSGGMLAPKPMKKALKAMQRFALMSDRNGVKTHHILATSAVRDAANGSDFVARVEAVMGQPVTLLSGADEARYAALGVRSGMPSHKGLVGDLGGGSLELAELGSQTPSGGETLALGAIRLQDEAGGDLNKAATLARVVVSRSSLLARPVLSRFIAVGGSWRALAKLHQLATDYPLHVVHNYVAPAADIARLCDNIVQQSIAGRLPSGLENFSASRAELVPFAAAVLAAVLETGSFEGVSFSALGVREGVLFEGLSNSEKAKDPLIEAAGQIGALRARDPAHGPELNAFADRFLLATGIAESRRDKRLRRAVCLLSDINWRGHPDYRGEQAIAMVAFGAFIGVDHGGRAQIAATLAVRHMGLNAQSASEDILDLAGPDGLAMARNIGAVLRLAFQLSAGRCGILPLLNWRANGQQLVLEVPLQFDYLASDKA